MRTLGIAIVTAGIICLWSASAAGEPVTAEQRVRSATMVYGIHHPSEEDFQRLLNAEPLDYILVQVPLTTGEWMEKEQERVRALAAAGKRVVLQFWWGPENWGYYSWPHFAFDREILDKFMKELMAPRLAGYAPGEVYGVHLLEETGMQFGIDSVGHTDPDDPFQLDPELSKEGNTYNQAFYADWGMLRGGPEIPNLLRYNDRFKRQTGLDMRKWRDWGFTDRYVFDRWCSRKIQAAGQAAVLREITRLRPDLKVFSWDGVFAEGELKRTQNSDLLDVVDGFVTDPYLPLYAIFAENRLLRTLGPDKEIITILWGGHAPDRVKRARLTAAYLGGADVIGFFELPAAMDYMTPQYLEQNLALHRVTTSLPVFEKTPRVLLVVDHHLRASFAWLRLKY